MGRNGRRQRAPDGIVTCLMATSELGHRQWVHVWHTVCTANDLTTAMELAVVKKRT